jgi:hypothetical protein
MVGVGAGGGPLWDGALSGLIIVVAILFCLSLKSLPSSAFLRPSLLRALTLSLLSILPRRSMTSTRSSGLFVSSSPCLTA